MGHPALGLRRIKMQEFLQAHPRLLPTLAEGRDGVGRGQQRDLKGSLQQPVEQAIFQEVANDVAF